MTATVANAPPEEISEPPAGPLTIARVGAASFSDLVRAHFRREQERATGDGFVSPDAEGEYRAKLEQFEREEGKLAAV